MNCNFYDGYLRYYMSLCDNPRDIKQRLVLTKKKNCFPICTI